MCIYLCLLILCCIHNSVSKCETEHSVENNFTVKWELKNNSNVALSFCLYDNNTLVKRICSDSKWFPIKAPSCKKIQKIFEPKCIEGDENYKDLCIHYSPPDLKSFQINQDIRLYNLNDSLIHAKIVKNLTEMWLPVFRKRKYGKFYWTDPYIKEKNEVYPNNLFSSNSYSTYDLDCMAATNITVNKKNNDEYDVNYVPKIVNCSTYLPTVYVYKSTDRYFIIKNKTDNYENKLFYSTKGYKAFYIHKKCKKIAEPRYEEDNFLIKQLIKNLTCKIGIRYSKKIDNYVWESTNEIINYTDWIQTTDFNFQEVVINANGWSLNETKFIQCYVCEIDRRNYVTDLILRKGGHNKLILIAHSYHTIYHSIVCYVESIEQYRFAKSSIKVHNEFDRNYSVIEATRHRTIWEIKINLNDPNYIQCNGSLFPNGDTIKTNKLLYGPNYNNEFAFKATFNYACVNYNCDPYLNTEYLSALKNFSHELKSIKSIRPITILHINESGDLRVLFHLRIIDNKNEIFAKFKQLKIVLENDFKKIRNVNSFKSCYGCLPNTVLVNNVSLKWNFTEIGVTAYNTKCIQSDSVPVTRKCIGDFLQGGTWLDVVGACGNNKTYKTEQQQEIAIKLNNLQNKIKTLSVTEIATNLAMLTEKSHIFQPLELITVSQIFKEIKSNITAENSTMVAKKVCKTLSNLLTINDNALKALSMSSINSTNEILDSIESILENVTVHNLNEKGVTSVVEPNFMYQFSNPFISNITGIALIRPKTMNKYPPFNEYKTMELTADTDIKELIEIEDLEAAAFIPRIILDEMRSNGQLNESIKINMMFYYNDSLFIEKNSTRNFTISTKVLSITLPGYDKLYSLTIPVIFRNFYPEKVNVLNCAYWDYGTAGQYSNRWENDNTAISEYLKERNIQICNFTHLTNFALLAGKYNSTDFMNDNILIYMTSIGSILSFIGIFAIFTTAVVFKSWRKAIGTKIVLNIALCLLLQSILLYGKIKINTVSCIITGTLLHYIVLCGFMWSLVMAYLHYLKFIKVLGNKTSHLVLKSLFFGWILPIIPIIIVHCINSKTYLPMDLTDNSFCYPSGIILYTTVHLPIAIIVGINLLIFSFIMSKVHTDTKNMVKFRTNCDKKEIIVTEIKLGILLFFSLSLSWIFGLFASTQYCDFCYYLFVATASSQGFVLFVYYVLFNKEVRYSWVKLVRPTSSSIPSSKNTNISQEHEIHNIDNKKNNEKVLRKRSNINEDNSNSKSENVIAHKLNNAETNVVMQELKDQLVKRNSPFRK